MQDYEIVYKYLNGCAGAAHPQTTFDEAALADTDSYIRQRHGAEFEKFVRQTLPDGRILYTYDNGTVSHIYEFTEL